MKIIIAGTGAMGATFGSLLKEAGNEVVFLDSWKENIDKINSEGIEFHDEGYPAQKTDIIKDGVLNTLLYNLKTAHKENKQSTGNACALGSGVKPLYMYFKEGTKTLEELINKHDEVLLINEIQALHSGANEVSGDFSLPAKGYLYKDGKIVQAVKSITVSGNYYELLKDIEEFANDTYVSYFQYASPSCILSHMNVAGDK